MKQIELFGKTIDARDYLCSSNKDKVEKGNASLRLYVKITDVCMASCKFCANECSKDYGKIDFKKLEYVVRYLDNNKYLSGISITGGEPMTNPNTLNSLINLLFEINPNMDICISTNGMNIREFEHFDNINRVEAIHISRHHYDDEKNNEIFGSTMAKAKDIMYLQDKLDDKKIININTMIMKSGINCLEEIKKNLDFVGELGVYKNGFVSLMKNNNYSKENFINYNSIFDNLDENFFTGNHFYSEKYCECIDGVYLTSNHKIVEYYARMIKECDCPYVRQLVYTSSNHVTLGFNGQKIY